jgi:hypothetical protein
MTLNILRFKNFLKECLQRNSFQKGLIKVEHFEFENIEDLFDQDFFFNFVLLFKMIIFTYLTFQYWTY